LSVLIGVAAISLDGGMATTERRHAQATADAAALSAAADLFANYQTNNGHDTNGSALASALATAAANGYSNNGTQSVVTVRVSPQPPLQGDPTITDASGNLKAGYAEVTVQFNQPRFFSAIWGQGTLPITARAVARGTWTVFNTGVLLLDPGGKGALTASGNGNLMVTGAPVILNSNNGSAAIVNGNGNITAPAFDFAGSPGFATSGGGQLNGPISSGVTPSGDPLAVIPPPNPSSLPLQTGGKISSSTSVTLNPGLYVGGLQISGQGTVTMLPGIYYMAGGGFSLTGQASLVGNGVMIYNAPANPSDVINISGQGSVTLSPMTTGIYQGISIFQDRNSTAALSISGNGSMNITGTFYAAQAALSISGNGGSNVIGSQYVSFDLSLGGSGGITINWSAATTARTRLFGLVE
jgi:hypothetical protein